VIGFLDDFKVQDPDNPQVKILGKLSDFVDVARREFIHKIFITVHPDSQVFLKLLEEAKELNIAVRLQMNKDSASPAWYIFEKDNILVLISGKVPEEKTKQYENVLNNIGKK
jgi:hypothetical protein